MKNTTILLVAFFLTIGKINSQSISAGTISLEKSINRDEMKINETQPVNEEIIQLIKNTSKKDLVSVVGHYEFSDQVIRTENLVFHDNSELVFTNYNYPYVIIAVKNLKFNAPHIKSIVKFGNFNLITLKGPSGGDGSKGENGEGDGANGKNATDGGTGGKGNTFKTPDIYLFVENINTDFGDISTFDWQIIGNGLQGGEGGNGGIGGNGGDGRGGRKASDGPGTCRRGGQNGGRGGNAGAGGTGGTGGDGGAGATVYLVGKKEITDKLTYAQYFLEGGNPGNGGQPGNSGQGGSGGSGGRGARFCGGGDRGGNGSVPAPLGKGEIGNKGRKGEVKIITRSITDLF